MKGKIGLVVGLGVGYVLGTRAGRERYEQIKTQWLKVWNLDPVQEQVTKVKGFVGDKAAAVPGAIWTGVVKVAKSVGGDGTPGQKLDSAIATGKDAAEDVAKATDAATAEARKTAAKVTASKSSSAKSAEAKADD
ncbi:hypothetical protein RS84_01383 [Microbacterium hydrocarbonoxydans]|jgi:hypothetical protein|uniref:Uncharacterized protein n=1 Tax=Microbacterium hydrocarbonoxydans TaxID=273678 RepID=A0A0M2HS67_9MICO|nr:hypothetical protein [Microbacterium hydrocarbonoxydans]KJL47755.1 hypothetical protein RS84_01383 [Microbacterium hydrocarbonoxydans]